MMKRIFLSAALLISMVCVQAEIADKIPNGKKAIVTKDAVVNFQKIINFDDPKDAASLEWQDLMAELEKKLKPRLTKLQDMQAKFQKDQKEAIEQNKFNDEDIIARLAKLKNDIEVDAKAYQAYSQKLMAEAQMQFGEKVVAVAKEIALEQGWTRVDALSGQTLWVSEACDITDDVVERMNKNYRAEQRAKKFAASNKVEKSL